MPISVKSGQDFVTLSVILEAEHHNFPSFNAITIGTAKPRRSHSTVALVDEFQSAALDGNRLPARMRIIGFVFSPGGRIQMEATGAFHFAGRFSNGLWLCDGSSPRRRNDDGHWRCLWSNVGRKLESR